MTEALPTKNAQGPRNHCKALAWGIAAPVALLTAFFLPVVFFNDQVSNAHNIYTHVGYSIFAIFWSCSAFSGTWAIYYAAIILFRARGNGRLDAKLISVIGFVLGAIPFGFYLYHEVENLIATIRWGDWHDFFRYGSVFSVTVFAPVIISFGIWLLLKNKQGPQLKKSHPILGIFIIVVSIIIMVWSWWIFLQLMN